MTNSLLYDLVSQMYVYSPEHEAPRDAIFQSEAEVIRSLADKGNCVIIGRCADYVLRNRANCLKVYLQASLPFRVERIVKTEQMEETAAIQKIRQMYRRRADNYHYYTQRLWGQAGNYDLTVSTELGMPAVEEIIVKALEAKATC